MTKAIRQLILLSVLLTGTSLYSQTKECKTKSTTLKGTYHGKNLMFQNNETNGIQRILLDKKEMSNKFSAAFELPLTDLKEGQKFELTIIYCDATPKPFKILNEDAVK